MAIFNSYVKLPEGTIFPRCSKMFQDSQVVVYNQSKYATNSVLADIRAVWGSRVRVIQTLEVPWDPIQTQVHPDFIFISGKRFSIYSDIFYIYIYIFYIFICVILRFSHHITEKISGCVNWLFLHFSIRPGRQPAATRDGCSALRASQVLGRFGSFQRAIGFHVHPGEGRMVKDGEGT